MEPLMDSLEQMKRQARLLDRRTFLRYSAGLGAGVLLGACGGGDSGSNTASGDGATSPAPGGAVGTAGAGAMSGSYSGPPVTLAFWNGFTGADGPLLRELVEQFSSETENITVEMNVMQWDEFYQTAPQAVGSGSGPDVGIMHIDQLATHAARGIIAPLDSMVSTLELSADDFIPAVWEAGIWQDQRYGIPLDTHPLGFYYNKDLMEQAGLDPESPPATGDEFMSALEALKAEGIQGHWISPFLFTGGLEFQSLLPQWGGSMYDAENRTATWGSEAGKEALSWMTNIIDEGYSPQDVAQDAENVAFQNGENAFIFNGIWMILGYRDTPDLNWGVAPMPKIGPEKEAVWASSHNFVAFQPRGGVDENKMQASTDFINWISEHSLQWAEAGQIPARSSVRESQEFQDLGPQTILAEQLDYVTFLPPLVGIGDAQGQFEDGFNEAVLQDKPDALEQSADLATRLLEQAAEQYGVS